MNSGAATCSLSSKPAWAAVVNGVFRIVSADSLTRNRVDAAAGRRPCPLRHQLALLAAILITTSMWAAAICAA
jgi:hypothetical protein